MADAEPPSSSIQHGGAGASPYSTGGGGTALEHRYGSLLLGHLLTGDPLPEVGSDATVVRVAFQTRAASAVDDFMIVGRGEDGVERRAFVAVRRRPGLVPSDKRSVRLVGTYIPALLNEWTDVETGRLRLALASTPTGPVRELAQLAAIARNLDESDFRAAVAEPGRTTVRVRKRLGQLDRIIESAAREFDLGAVSPPELTWRFLSSMAHVRELRLEPPDESDDVAMTARLREETVGGTAAEASRLTLALRALAGRYAPLAAIVDQASLRRDLAGTADLRRSSGHQAAWRVFDRLQDGLRTRTRTHLSDSSRQLSLDRTEPRSNLENVLEATGSRSPDSPPALVIAGEPDVGKSALTLRAADDVRSAGAAVIAISLRDLPSTTVEAEHLLAASLKEVLAGTEVRPARLLVVDGAEAALEGRTDLLRDLAAAALAAGLGVAAVTRNDGEQQGGMMLRDAAESSGLDPLEPARFAVAGLTSAEIAQAVGTFPMLARLGRDPRNGWLLARPGLLDLLLRAGSTPVLPEGSLTEADVFRAVWYGLVRRNESSLDGGVTPDEREQALLALARHALDQGTSSDNPWPAALPSLRSDGLLLPAGPAAAWRDGDEFASDLVRDFTVARLLLRDGYQLLLSPGDPPRWALRAARLACQAALSASDDTERTRREQQAKFDEVAEIGGARWSEVPTEAVLPLRDALARAWPALSTESEEGLATTIQVALQRYASSGIADADVLAPLIELLHDRPPATDRHVPRGLGEQIGALRLAWLSGLVVSDRGPNPLRAKIRDGLLAHRVGWDESFIEALALLGPDLDDGAGDYLRELATEAPAYLAPAVESPIAIHSLIRQHPELLTDLTEAYYVDTGPVRYSGADDGIRDHWRARGFGSPMADRNYGPFWQLLIHNPRGAVRVINRMLNHAAQVRVKSLNELTGGFEESRADNVPGIDIDLPGAGRRFCVGDSHVWMWYRGSGVGPYPCMSALLAVERFADQLIAAGFELRAIARLLLEDCHNLAMPGLVVGMLVRHVGRVGDELDIWLSEPQLWQLEFTRGVQEGVLHVQGTDPADTPGRDRRDWNLRDAAAFLVLNALARGDKARLEALRERGHELMRRARGAVPGLDPDDDGRDLDLSELTTVAGWAATFDAATYGPETLPDGRVAIQHRRPDHIEAALQDHHEGQSPMQESYRLITTYALAGDRDIPSEAIRDDLLVARSLLEDRADIGALGPQAVPAAVAKAAVLAHADGLIALSEEELRWAADLLIACATDPYVGDFAYGETVNVMEADRASAAALPTLLMLAGRGESGAPALHQVERGLVASATSQFHEVRRITATSLAPVWDSECTPAAGGRRCIHDAALNAAAAAARICRLAPADSAGRRHRWPITGPVGAGLSNVDPEDINPVMLVAPIIATGSAVASESCVRESAADLLDALLQAHIRTAAYWAERGHYTDPLRHQVDVSQVLFSQAARGEPSSLVRHVAALAPYPAALGHVLRNFSELATYDAGLRGALADVWPLVMRAALDIVNGEGAYERPRHSTDRAIAGLLPQPALRLDDRDPDASLARASAGWIDPVTLSVFVDHWTELGRGRPQCVDAMVGLVRTAAPEWQATVGLRWVDDLIGGTFDELAGRRLFLSLWIKDLIVGGRLDAEGWARVHRIVDGMAASGDAEAVELQQAEE